MCAPLFGCVRLLLAPRYLNISNQRRQGHDLSSIEDSHVLELGEQDFKDLEGLGPALESPPGLSDVSLADSDMHYTRMKLKMKTTQDLVVFFSETGIEITSFPALFPSRISNKKKQWSKKDF